MSTADWTLHETPHRHYRYMGSWNGAGKQRIVSVTQVLAGPSTLTDWAERQALVAGEWVAQNWLGSAPVLAKSLLSFQQMAALSGLLPSQVRDAKGASGDAIHKYLRAKLLQTWPLPDAPYGLRMAIDRIVRELQPMAVTDIDGPQVERIVGDYRRAVAGTYDARVSLRDLSTHRWDLKQSGSVQPEHFAQLAGYEELATVCGESPSDFLTIMHIDDLGNFEPYSIAVGSADYGYALQHFLAALALYRTGNKLKKVLKHGDSDAG